MNSWRTSIVGLVLVALGIALMVFVIRTTPLSAEAMVLAGAIITTGLGFFLAKDSAVTGGTVAATKEAFSRVPPPSGGGFAGLRLLGGLTCACLLLTAGCGVHVSGGLYADGGDLAITVPDGTTIGVRLAGSAACVEGPFVKIPFFNQECDTACASLVGNFAVELQCRTIGDTVVRPVQFALSAVEQKKATALISSGRATYRQDTSVRLRPVSATGNVKH
jgi:hypothetical protein